MELVILAYDLWLPRGIKFSGKFSKTTRKLRYVSIEHTF